MTDLIDDLYAYNDWANDKILTLCDGLTDEQLDRPREMGMGTLRATLFHILTADQVWMERWQSIPWREFPIDPSAMSVADIRAALAEVAGQRRELIDANRSDHFATRIAYQDSKQTPYDHVLLDLLLHVANHGVHHRAQALSYLKQFERTVPAGLDYLFYRLATASVEQSPEAVAGLTGFGLGVSEPTSEPVPFDSVIVQRLFQYSDWATGQILDLAADLPDESLDRDFQMGTGSIRSNLLHMFDAERWWQTIWTTEPIPFPQSPRDMAIADVRDQWQALAPQRNDFIAQADEQSVQRVVTVMAGGPPTRFQIGVSMVQLPLHGTHHRGQLINMLRHVDAPWQNIDLLYAIDQM